MIRVDIVETADCGPEVVWGVFASPELHLTDSVGRYACRVTRPVPDGLSYWTVHLRGSRLEWAQTEALDRVRRRGDFVMARGTPARLEGQWSVTQEVRRTVLSWGCLFDFGFPHIADAVDPVFEATMRDVVKRLVDAAIRVASREVE